MGFDDATLEPTYVLRLGAPGKSAGLDIASRLGLDPALIENARGRMAASDRDVSRFLGEMHQRLEQLETERAELAARSQALALREQGLEQTWERKYIREDSRSGKAGGGFIGGVRTPRAGDHRGSEPEGAHQNRQNQPRVSGTGRLDRASTGSRRRRSAVETRARCAGSAQGDPAAGDDT